MDGVIYINGLLFGLGLAVDSFLIALTDGLDNPNVKIGKLALLAAMFAAFQILMPMLGWLCMHTVAVYVDYFDKVLSWIAFAVMLFFGVRMIVDGVKKQPLERKERDIGISAVILQCFVTSVDSLAVGFAIANYTVISALVCSIVIGSVTFIMFCLGYTVGKRFGLRFADAASVIGGIVFIGIGIEILITTLI
ncbi:MAG: manganese efflux pump [Clostridiales bacterium]|nr:manganese efflux pump [Clostridiales bacterium]